MSEREPELGLGVVEHVDPGRIAIRFPAVGERRLYARGTSVLKRVTFRPGDTVTAHDGPPLRVESVEDDAGLLVYVGDGRRLREDALSDQTSVTAPVERFLSGQVDPGAVFDLRLRTLQAQARFRTNTVRGLLGGRIELIPHQLYIAGEVSSRQLPRVLLADEVGLGKTIEACLIVQRLLTLGKARRVLVLVPESLVHQWFVELLRRFNLWFTILDEARCAALASGDETKNPFLETQLALGAISFLADHASRRAQAVEAGWDVVVVDEAHHLEWTPERASPDYALVAELAARTPGLLLLTATPTQHGLVGHFARLRLLDPHRYEDYGRFVAETEQFGAVAGIIDKLLNQVSLTPDDRLALERIFDRDPERLSEVLDRLEGKETSGPGDVSARQTLMRTLLDQHGTGRVMLRNTRAVIPGFPQRVYCPVPLTVSGEAQPNEGDAGVDEDAIESGTSAEALRARVARELRAEETGEEAAIRYTFRQDPRVQWIVGFLREHRPAKVLMICRSKRKVLALGAALTERMHAKIALFHEELPLIQRDRNAAWFAEPDGAQLLICSEIGSEGRNFQFAHHLILFDLPLNPGLVEQRIGRLDRIGQTQPIRIHVPFLVGSAQEAVADWYHRGVDAFAKPLPGGDDYVEQFHSRLLELALALGEERKPDRAAFEALIAETAAFRRRLETDLQQGRDRLLELNSFDRAAGRQIVDRIRSVDADPFLRRFLLELLDHFGVRIKEHEEGDVFLDPSHAYLEAFPSIPAEGMLATFDRSRAIAREDVVFLTIDHPLVQDAADLLVDSPRGSTAFGVVPADRPNLLLEAVFVLEAVADARWHVDQFLPPTPVRVVVDAAGRDLSGERDAASVAAELEDSDLHRFLEGRGFGPEQLKSLLEAAGEGAARRVEAIKRTAAAAARLALGADVQRLVDLRRVNDHIRPEEIALAQQQLERTEAAIAGARLRLDALRVILESPQARA